MNIKEAAYILCDKIKNHPNYISMGVSKEIIYVNVTNIGSEELKFPNGFMGYNVVVKKSGIPKAMPFFKA